MIIELFDWKFDVDVERTMARSALEAAEHCDCAYCRNFYATVDEENPELRYFLAEFGLDIEAPDVLYPYDISEEMCYEGEYVVFGRILSHGCAGINVGGCYICPTNDSTHSLPQPHFTLSLEGLQLPWVLHEPLQDVVSTANEPSFLKKMWQRLLPRLNKTKEQ